MMRSLLALGLIFSCVYTGDASLDWVVDVILDNVREAMVRNNATSASIPSFNKSVQVTFMGMNFHAVVSAKDGSLSNISTVERRSRASISQEGTDDVVTIVSNFGLTDLEISYDQFNAVAMGSETKGPMTAKCSSDSFSLNVTASRNKYGSCTTNVNNAHLNTLGKCSVNVGTGGIANWFRDYLFTFLLNHYDAGIVRAINAQIIEVVKKNLEPVDLCKYLQQGTLVKK